MPDERRLPTILTPAVRRIVGGGPDPGTALPHSETTYRRPMAASGAARESTKRRRGNYRRAPGGSGRAWRQRPVSAVRPVMWPRPGVSSARCAARRGRAAGGGLARLRLLRSPSLAMHPRGRRRRFRDDAPRPSPPAGPRSRSESVGQRDRAFVKARFCSPCRSSLLPSAASLVWLCVGRGLHVAFVSGRSCRCG